MEICVLHNGRRSRYPHRFNVENLRYSVLSIGHVCRREVYDWPYDLLFHYSFFMILYILGAGKVINHNHTYVHIYLW
jgi:hypothetical protein